MNRSIVDRDLYEYLECLGFDPAEISASPATVPPPAQAKPQSTTILSLEWSGLLNQALECLNCKLSKCRSKVVFGAGDLNARLMFVGEGPGDEEDKQGLPFMGRAGELLEKMIQAMGLRREDVYLTSVVKCRPPENRNPDADEIAACSEYLKKQIGLVDPEVVVALGTFAGQALLASDLPIGRLRGDFRSSPLQKRKDGSDLWILATYHPAFLLRNPSMKKPVWEDLQKVMQKLGLKA